VGIVKRWFCSTLLVLSVAASACGTGTAVISSYKEPELQWAAFRKVLVVAPMADPAQRRQAEDKLARHVRAPVVVASYKLIPYGELCDRETLDAHLQRLGFDGVVVYRIVTADQYSWVPGVTPGPTYAFGGWPPGTPRYVNMREFVRTETAVYAVPGERLVWAGLSTTYNPGSITWLVGDSSWKNGRAMRRQAVVVLK
jgi:hypothetical protein